ncbi:hypothetical protein [Microbacterium sp. 179-I 3D3 NHS]|uniref:hypothetical protein n=1 Tax=Microbacterium sp. 179-I 3D3 NHS TaxID=3142382 RepID=UPI0039A28377
MILHRDALFPVCGLVLLSLLVSACSPTPQPTPTPTPAFASEEEAFAAAEETYRAYIDALNEVDLDDPGSFEPVFARSTGEFESGDRKNLSTLSAEGLTISGSNIVTGFVPLDVKLSTSEVLARVCVDVSGVLITDEAGVSHVSPERSGTYAINVSFVVEDGDLLIASAEHSDETDCDL